MHSSRVQILLSLASLVSAGHVEVIERDVVVIGGGGAGAYTAARLQQEGASIALVEKENRLGGHVNTYTDPTSGATTDYGVVVWANISVVTDFWSHYNLSLVSVGSLGVGTQAADFKTGTVFPAELSKPDPAATASNLTAYINLLENYPGLISTWEIPYPVPEDLLIDFGSFIDKYDLSLTATYAAQLNQGSGNILALPAIYGLKAFDIEQAKALLTSSFLTNPTGNTQQLYDRVEAELGENVFLNACVDRVVRSDESVEVTITTPEGQTRIKASKLVVTVPPILENIGFLDLDDREKHLYGRFNSSYYWNSVVTHTGLPQNTSFNNVDIAAPDFIPAVPAVYTVQSVARIPGAFQIYFGSPSPFTDEEVKAEIISTIARLREGLKLPDPENGPDIVAFNSHNPFALHVTRGDVAAGFYRDWLALQGHKRTWWNGRSMVRPASYAIWNFTETELLPKLLH